MAVFSQGKYALAISDRSGLAFPYNEMVREWNGALVHISEFEPKQPQLEPKPTMADPQALQRARPARTEFATQDFLPFNPFTTASNTTLTVAFENSQFEVNDVLRFVDVKEPVGGVSIAAFQLQTTLNGDISDSATTVTLTDASNFPTAGFIMIEKVNATTGVYENEVIELTGFGLASSIGAVSTVAKANVTPEGQSATASVGIILIWGEVDTSQTPDYQNVATSQTPNYTTIKGGRDAA